MERDIFLCYRACEARPSCTRVEFIEGGIERDSAHDIDINPYSFIIMVFILERLLRSAFLSDRILKWSQSSLQLLFGREFFQIFCLSFCIFYLSLDIHVCHFFSLCDVVVVIPPDLLLILFPSRTTRIYLIVE